MRISLPSRAYGFALALLSVLAGVLFALVLPSGARAAEACPNEAIRAEQGAEVMALPDCMALEQVSPSKKGNQLARAASRVSADGARLAFSAVAELDPETPIYEGLGGDLYVASRNENSGWATEGANVPYGSGGSVEGGNQVSFTPDLSSWLQLVSLSEGSQEFFREGLGHSFSTLSPPLKNLTGSINSVEFQGASADLSHVYFEPQHEGGEPPRGSYIAGDPQPEGTGEDANLYVAHLGSSGQPTLELLARDRNGKVWGANCGARLGGIEPTTGTLLNLPNGARNQGSISTDGSRVYFSTRPGQSASGNCTEANKKRVMVRDETSFGPVISELFQSECTRISPACSTTDGNDAYQGASVDQAKVYFTTTRQLANSDLDTGTECSITVAAVGCDLSLYDSTKPPGERLIQVSAGETDAHHEAGKEAKVYNGIAAISADGSRVYFVAQGVLTEHHNPEGAVAEAGKPNFYTWDAETGKLSFIGILNTGDHGGIFGLWGAAGGNWGDGAYSVPIAGEDAEGHEVGGDGHILLFKTKAALTATDTDGAFRDVYRYNADTEALTCISCRPGGPDSEPYEGNPTFGPGNKPPGTDYAVINRPISEDGETIEFTTTEGMLPGEPSGIENVYLWQLGQVYHLPGSAKAATTVSNPPSLSANGSTLAYHTITKLLPSDGDSTSDVYVARVDGGYPVPKPEEPCVGEACQQHSPQPGGQGAASESFSGTGNVSLVQPTLSKPVVKHKALTRAQKLANALKACRKKPRKKRAACEKRARKRYPAKAKSKKRVAKTKTKQSSGKGSK